MVRSGCGGECLVRNGSGSDHGDGRLGERRAHGLVVWMVRTHGVGRYAGRVLVRIVLDVLWAVHVALRWVVVRLVASWRQHSAVAVRRSHLLIVGLLESAVRGLLMHE